jgi:hypothetical protein
MGLATRRAYRYDPITTRDTFLIFSVRHGKFLSTRASNTLASTPYGQSTPNRPNSGLRVGSVLQHSKLSISVFGPPSRVPHEIRPYRTGSEKKKNFPGTLALSVSSCDISDVTYVMPKSPYALCPLGSQPPAYLLVSCGWTLTGQFTIQRVS